MPYVNSKRGQQQEAAFEELKARAAAFNSLIDSAMALLDSMRLLAAQTGGRSFEVAADLTEMPYAAVYESKVRIRRRFDVLRG
jgi:hypothetical protein